MPEQNQFILKTFWMKNTKRKEKHTHVAISPRQVSDPFLIHISCIPKENPSSLRAWIQFFNLYYQFNHRGQKKKKGLRAKDFKERKGGLC